METKIRVCLSPLQLALRVPMLDPWLAESANAEPTDMEG